MASEWTKEWQLLVAQNELRHKKLSLDNNHDLRRDRFTNIRPWTSNKLLLKKVAYINASPVTVGHRRYIATQAPLPLTTSDFWAMVLEVTAPLIVTLANLKEESDPASLYWPTAQSFAFNVSATECLVVSLQKETQEPLWAERTLTVQSLSRLTGAVSQEHTVQQLEFKVWPDHGVPSSTDQFIQFLRRYDQLASTGSGVSVVHCLAGVGRTGTFIAAHTMLKHIKLFQQNISRELINLVNSMRDMRPWMVQTFEQFAFLHRIAEKLAS